MIAAGLGTALGWRWLGYQDMVYEGMPGMLAGWLTYRVTRQTSPHRITRPET